MKTRRTQGPARQGLRQTIEGFGKLKLKVGFFETAKYEDGTPVAYVATIQEYGSGPIPPRPFMRPTQQREQTNWNEGFASGARAVAEGRRTAEQVLGAIGGNAAGEISATIASITAPPLTQTTLLARKHKQQGGTLSGSKIGELNRNANFIGPRERGDDSADVSGVSTKPLVFDGILIASPTFVVE